MKTVVRGDTGRVAALELMTWGRLARLLCDAAVAYRNWELANTIGPALDGKELNQAVIRQLMDPYINEVLRRMPPKEQEEVRSRYEEFVPNAMLHVRNDSHMNESDETDIVTSANADAILAAFLNRAVVPIDLAFYAKHLSMNEWNHTYRGKPLYLYRY